MRRRLAFADILEHDGAVVNAGNGDFHRVDIDRFHRQAIGVFARQDDTRALETDESGAVCEVNRNGLTTLQCAAIGSGQAGKDRGGAAGAEGEAADAQLAAFHGQGGPERGAEFDIGGIVCLRVEGSRKYKAGKGLFGRGVDAVAEIGEVLIFCFARLAAGFLALAGSHLVRRRALDQHIRVGIFIWCFACLRTATRGETCQNQRKNNRLEARKGPASLHCHDLRPPMSAHLTLHPIRSAPTGRECG